MDFELPIHRPAGPIGFRFDLRNRDRRYVCERHFAVFHNGNLQTFGSKQQSVNGQKVSGGKPRQIQMDLA